ENRARLFAVKQTGRARRQLFKFANMGIDPLHNQHRLKGSELLLEGLAHWVRIHRLGEDLQGKDVVISIDDEAWQKICFAENQPVSVTVLDYSFPVGNCLLQTLAQQRIEIRHDFTRQQTDRNLRCAAIQGRAQKPAALVFDSDQRPWLSTVRRDDV